MQKIQSQQDLTGIWATANDDLFKLIHEGVPIHAWLEGEPEGVPGECFEWNIPEKYKRLDWWEYVLTRFANSGLPVEYEERLILEHQRVTERKMEDFIRVLIYVVETIRENNITLGVGRGSACASLILFLIGVHRVDPVLYGIPMEEFFKV